VSLVFLRKSYLQTTAKQACSNQSSSFYQQRCSQWHQINRILSQRLSQYKNVKVEERRLILCLECLIVIWADSNSKIYATAEKRKQRNCVAQAVFRERRTEYIQQLTSNIKHKTQKLEELQTIYNKISDDCLMLQYRYSFLERILLEKDRKF